MYNMVKQLLEEGVPIDGIGLQMHIDYETDLDAMDRCMRVLGRLREIDRICAGGHRAGYVLLHLE